MNKDFEMDSILIITPPHPAPRHAVKYGEGTSVYCQSGLLVDLPAAVSEVLYLSLSLLRQTTKATYLPQFIEDATND